MRRANDQACTTRYTPADQIEEIVWQDLCSVPKAPEQIAAALGRTRGGHWLPQAQLATIKQAFAGVERQQVRLLDAYLARVLSLPEFEL